jgi:hypothetical protein
VRRRLFSLAFGLALTGLASTAAAQVQSLTAEEAGNLVVRSHIAVIDADGHLGGQRQDGWGARNAEVVALPGPPAGRGVTRD